MGDAYCLGRVEIRACRGRAPLGRVGHGLRLALGRCGRLVRLEIDVQDLAVCIIRRKRSEEPELVLLDGTAQGGVEIVREQLVRVLEAGRGKFRRDVARLKVPAAAVRDALGDEAVAALLGDQVHADAARGKLRPLSARVVDQFFGRRFLRLGGAPDAERAGAAADQVHARLVAVHHVVAVVRVRAVRDDASIRAGHDHAGDERGSAPQRAASGQLFELFLRQHRLSQGVLDVDHRRGAGHSDRLLEGADAQVGVDVRGECSRELDAFAFDGTESGDRERHRVCPGRKIDDGVHAGTVGDDRAYLFDQYWTACFNGDPGQHRARGVLHHARDTRLSLRSRDCRHQHRADQRNCDP